MVLLKFDPLFSCLTGRKCAIAAARPPPATPSLLSLCVCICVCVARQLLYCSIAGAVVVATLLFRTCRRRRCRCPCSTPLTLFTPSLTSLDAFSFPTLSPPFALVLLLLWVQATIVTVSAPKHRQLFMNSQAVLPVPLPLSPSLSPSVAASLLSGQPTMQNNLALRQPQPQQSREQHRTGLNKLLIMCLKFLT